MLSATMIAAITLSGILGAGFMANEATHGGMAEAMGMGHQHMFDYGGQHCTDASHRGEHMDMQHMEGMAMHDGRGSAWSMHENACGGAP